jgi:uncharacterized FlaG/YvyC family protein
MPMDISPVSLPAANRSNEPAPGFAQTTAASPGTQNQDAGGLKTASLTPSQDQVTQAVKQANASFASKGQNLYAMFEKDPATDISVVKIMDSSTHEVINQMPPKAIVEFALSLEQSRGKSGQIISFKV